MVYTCESILFSIKRMKYWYMASTWMNLQNIMLNERSQMQKVTCCMIVFIWSVSKKKIYRERKQRFPRAGEGAGLITNGTPGNYGLGGCWKCSKTELWRQMYNSVHLVSLYHFIYCQVKFLPFFSKIQSYYPPEIIFDFWNSFPCCL